MGSINQSSIGLPGIGCPFIHAWGAWIDWSIDWPETKTVTTPWVLNFPGRKLFYCTQNVESNILTSKFSESVGGEGVKLEITVRLLDWLIDWLTLRFSPFLEIHRFGLFTSWLTLQCYTIPLGGMCVRQPVATGGSGSTYVFGYVDQNYRKGMNKQQCLEFVANCKSLPLHGKIFFPSKWVILCFWMSSLSFQTWAWPSPATTPAVELSDLRPSTNPAPSSASTFSATRSRNSGRIKHLGGRGNFFLFFV